MGNHKNWLAAACAVGALVLAPGLALAAGSAYPVPKVTGGTGSTKAPAKSAGTAIQKTSQKTLASKGISIKVHFTAAGTITVTVAGPGTSGKGSATAKKAGNATVKVKFSKVGKAGSKVTVIVTFKPASKKGKSATSKTTVTLG
jgi:hypothetical protein